MLCAFCVLKATSPQVNDVNTWYANMMLDLYFYFPWTFRYALQIQKTCYCIQAHRSFKLPPPPVQKFDNPPPPPLTLFLMNIFLNIIILWRYLQRVLSIFRDLYHFCISVHKPISFDRSVNIRVLSKANLVLQETDEEDQVKAMHDLSTIDITTVLWFSAAVTGGRRWCPVVTFI